ncbi:hypothetical protein DL768_011298 [Monosporascus sp. mg162]|nr:hypothetical protein DL768_011298 [Monosporascus sp. mg162]
MSANPQTQSGFVNRLPREIRNAIYLGLWRSCGLRQHICGTAMWRIDTSSPWMNHWPCGEQAEKEHGLGAIRGATTSVDVCWKRDRESEQDRPWSSAYIPMLLSCGLYIEMPSLRAEEQMQRQNAWGPLAKTNCKLQAVATTTQRETAYSSMPPSTSAALGNRDCHAEHSHYDMQDGQQDSWSSNGCRLFALGKTMKAGDAKIYWHPVGMGADYHQNYKISWIDGCRISATEQSVESPIEADQRTSCASSMRANYLDCNNKGASSSMDAGRLRYDFYATD